MSQISFFERLRIRLIIAEVSIVDKIGKHHDCGCVSIFWSRRIFCWEHAMANFEEGKK